MNQHDEEQRINDELQGAAAATSEVGQQPHDVFIAHAANRQVISGLKMGTGVVTVLKWDDTKRARGWTLTGADLMMDRGRPFGSLWYRHDDSRYIRVGVHWNHDIEQLECLCLHPKKPQLPDDVDEFEASRLERDARSRIGTLMAVNAEIGSIVATRASEDAILAAAGLGLKRLDR